MNEWAHKKFIPSFAPTDKPPIRAYCQNWEEGWDQDRTNTNLKAMNGYGVRDYQKPNTFGHHFMAGEDVGIPSCYSPKKKKTGAPDPRFKRVISSDAQNNLFAETKTEMNGLTQSLDSSAKDTISTDKTVSYLKAPNESALFSKSNSKKFEDQKEICQPDLSDLVTKDVGFSSCAKFFQGSHHLGYHDGHVKDLEKVKSNFNANMKRSMSDCTLHTKNTLEDENEEEISKIRPYPSATRVNKVHNWIKEYKMFPEKRRSVITVIGQTQTKSFSKILNEIKQRRKLAKELDKHALCEAIMESAEINSDVKNLLAKVDLVLPDGKVIHSTEKVYLCKGNEIYRVGKNNVEYSQKSVDMSDANVLDEKKRREMIPEKDPSVGQIGRRNKVKRGSKKLGDSVKLKSSKDKIRPFYVSFLLKLFWSLLLLGFLAISTYISYNTVYPSKEFVLFEFWKPKTTKWYEKLFLK